MMDELSKEVIKNSLLRLVRDHNEKCGGCDVSMGSLRKLATLAGIEFTPEEIYEFI